ncbi:MAG: DUF5916 domain-containing protein [Bacteroidetes bacterium]|nr:DUF5916 domain-containing protein [Bacteroidota bacterium]
MNLAVLIPTFLSFVTAMKRTITTLLLLLLLSPAFSRQPEPPHGKASRTSVPPRIDGVTDEAEWKLADVITGFNMFVPVYDVPSSFQTQVRILYDDQAIYLAATMFDPHPDSILRQLGNRDEENLNADYFQVGFDTYNNQLDAYYYKVYASGVQCDSREADDTYDGVWTSQARISKSGWTLEMKIPYSSLRFPKTEIQTWRMQVLRSVRRYRELDQWVLEVKGAPNSLVFWGYLDGINRVDPVTRLSVTPYLSATYENLPQDISGQSDDSYSISGGLDLKYGLDESFTLDMSLLPDFSQVQSDNQIKNLTAFETVYEEQRPFFKEAVDLFQKGNLFYTRRIGRIPLGFYTVEDSLKPGERLEKNPPAAKLLNATKISGRTANGMAIGIFNAITDNTYATVEDTEGKTRRILTDPKTNYNILVFDQALRNNSSLYLINTNVIRNKNYPDANVTGSGLNLFDKSNTVNLTASGAISQIYSKEGRQNSTFADEIGYKYLLGLYKKKGRLQYGIDRSVMDDHFSANDMGITLHNNLLTHYGYISLNQFEPWWKIRESQVMLKFNDDRNFVTKKITGQFFELNAYCTNLRYLSLWTNLYIESSGGFDYYEPRKNGWYYLKPRYHSIDFGYSSDYRKPFALDWTMEYVSSSQKDYSGFSASLSPLVRVNDHLFFVYTFKGLFTTNDIGYAATDSLENPVFGKRNITEFENIFSGRYMFRNNLSLNLRLRHYWSSGEYSSYYYLKNNGDLSGEIPYPSKSDFNFNSLTIDLVLWWEFAPGSRLNLIWKNAILNESQQVVHNYWNNFKDTWNSPQDNSFTLKFLYYLDYQYLKKHNKP